MVILLVKTSSLGDVIHNLPAVSDLRVHFPDVAIDWVVEESFAEIPRLHPAVRRVIPVATRRWRRQIFSSPTRQAWATYRAAVRSERYTAVIDTQGLLKSALLARQALGRRIGYAATSAREPWAARFYAQTFDVAKELHAVERNRRLVALALGYEISGAPDYGLGAITRSCGEPESAMLLTATSRDDKLWPEASWIALGRYLGERGVTSTLAAGNATERQRAERLAAAIPGARVLPPSGLADLAGALAASRLVVGVDTGLMHLAAAVGRPCIAVFAASEPTRTGVLADRAGAAALNLGRRGEPPSAADVIAAAARLL